MAERWGLDVIYHDANPNNCYRAPLVGTYASADDARRAMDREYAKRAYDGTGEVVVFVPARPEHGVELES